MIILVSKDFLPLAHALQKRYHEPLIELFDHPHWLRDLAHDNQGKFIARLTIIGHGDNLYSDDQVYFGGNQQEKVMLVDEFAHILLDLLKYNERLKPGFCKHLKVIDIIDCHQGKQEWIAQIIAKRFHEDPYIREHSAHIKINSFVNQHHPHAGSILMPHPKEKHTLSFYAFDSIKTYTQYKKGHTMLDQQKTALHHLLQLPGHTKQLANGQNIESAITELQNEYEATQKAERALLKSHTHKHLHIADPRQYVDEHSECQAPVAKPPFSTKKAKRSTHVSHSVFNKNTTTHHPRIPHPKHTSYLEGNTFKQAEDPTDEGSFNGQIKQRKHR